MRSKSSRRRSRAPRSEIALGSLGITTMEPASISLTEPTSPPSRARAAAAATTPGASSILTFWLSPERAEPTPVEALAILREAASKSALTVAELRRFLAAHTTTSAATDAVRATVAWRSAHPELDDVPQLLPLLTDCVASVARGVYHLRPRAPQLEALSAGVTVKVAIRPPASA